MADIVTCPWAWHTGHSGRTGEEILKELVETLLQRPSHKSPLRPHRIVYYEP